MHNFTNKKIGIWGFGIVGKSALNYFQQHTKSIQILDQNTLDHPAWIQQTEEAIQTFLQNNDYILASPGIPLHAYEQYHEKFLTELDIFAQEYKNTIIAITGTLGKTSITSLLQQNIPNSIAAGNIGYALLNLLTENKQSKEVVLELSSFQLQHIKKFSPDLSIWTNFYPNHLDHHTTEEEYFTAKCNIIKYQNKHQTTLLPCNLVQQIKQHIAIQANIYTFCTHQCENHEYPTYFIKNNSIYLNNKIIFANILDLSEKTFVSNWLVIIAALHIQKKSLEHVIQISQQLQPQEHRLEKIGTFDDVTFYNDSKSTVWQATKQAINNISSNEPCVLFLGGLSKGADRTPLIRYVTTRPITILAFGKEKEIIQKLCDTYGVPCHSFENLDGAFKHCMRDNAYKNILFSPAGASFDLFKNYQERGNYFKRLVFQLRKK